MSRLNLPETGLLTTRRLIVQLVGFAIGIALLAWIVKGAIDQGDWSKIREADPGLLAILLGCTVVSLLINGTMFWIGIRPVKRLPFWDLQFLNVVANMLNYAPIRVGAIARVAYHLRVDRLRLLQIGAWFAFLGYLVILGIAAFLVATWARVRLDWIWLLLVVAMLGAGGLLCRMVAGARMLARYGQGLGEMMRDPAAVWTGLVLRIADLAAFAGRMAAALVILEIRLPAAHVVALAVVATGASMTPLGRVGIREWCVAEAAALLSMSEAAVSGSLAQLALLESAGEALVYIPLGAVALLWYRGQWIGAGWAAANPGSPSS